MLLRTASAQADQRQRLLVNGHAHHVPMLPVERERLLQRLRGAVKVAHGELRLAQVRQGSGEPDIIADLTGDSDAVFKQGPRGVRITEEQMGGAEAVEFSCLLVTIAEVAPDGQAALQEPQRGIEFA